MPGRVLNFSEFFGKYSSEPSGEKNLDNFTQSSSNFEEGFDDSTYDQNQLGPNRPVSSEIEVTPVKPGETGSPKFSSNIDKSMDLPEDMPETTELEEEPEPKKSLEKPEDETTPEPEIGLNPKSKKSNESFQINGFTEFIMESDDFEEEPDELPEYDESDDSEFNDSMCQNCGIEIGYSPEGASCGCNA
jgi:hypothetical protein